MSSMVQDAYDMGITSTLGGMPNSSFYSDDSESYIPDEDNNENDIFVGTKDYILKMNIKRKRAVLHFSKECAGSLGNYLTFDNEECCNEFLEDNLYDYSVSECSLCADYKEGKEEVKKTKIPKIDIDEDEIPF